MAKISVVVPCYKSEGYIAGTVSGIAAVLDGMDGSDYEIILVSDASPDDVFGEIEKLAATDPRIKGIEFSRNFGQHAALLAGYRIAGGDYVVSMDDDGQTPAESIPALLEKLREGHDVAFARYMQIKQTGFRRLCSAANQRMMEVLLGKPRDITTTSFFAMQRYVCDEIAQANTPYPYVAGLVFRTTRRIVNVDVEHRERQAGDSGYSFAKLASLWLNGFTSFSVKPLRIASVVGMVTALAGFVGMVAVFANKFIHPEAPLGYSSTMAVMLFLGGAIMLMLGMIGEYVGRVFISMGNTPAYVVRRTTGMGGDGHG